MEKPYFVMRNGEVLTRHTTLTKARRSALNYVKMTGKPAAYGRAWDSKRINVFLELGHYQERLVEIRP
jgi:hypothetical protein